MEPDAAADRPVRSGGFYRIVKRHVGSTAGWRLAIVACLTFVSSGCSLPDWARNGFKVGPNYCPPPAPVASEWIDAADPRIKSEPADLAAWWQVFGDPVLNQLIESAYRQNLSLRVADGGIEHNQRCDDP